ncbi:MAG: hypothetical protein D6720_10390 [Gammaproteobacteria bacterium]|nr:MAG: hypothetical protein D6720_10390 [Gammaproteobacteria bacterium]
MLAPLARLKYSTLGIGMATMLLASTFPASAGASGWGPWNSGRSWNWHTPKDDSFFSWGTGRSDNPWDKWGPWNKRKQYPWESDRWDKLPWSGNRPWDRGGFDMPWSKKKARRERRKDYLEYLKESRQNRLRRKLRYSRPPYPPPYGYGYGYGYGYAPPGGFPAPVQSAPAPAPAVTPRAKPEGATQAPKAQKSDTKSAGQ